MNRISRLEMRAITRAFDAFETVRADVNWRGNPDDLYCEANGVMTLVEPLFDILRLPYDNAWMCAVKTMRLALEANTECDAYREHVRFALRVATVHLVDSMIEDDTLAAIAADAETDAPEHTAIVDSNSLASRVRWVVESGRVESARKWSLRAGLSAKLVSTFLDRARTNTAVDMTLDTVRSLAFAAGLREEWLCFGTGDAVDAPEQVTPADIELADGVGRCVSEETGAFQAVA